MSRWLLFEDLVLEDHRIDLRKRRRLLRNEFLHHLQDDADFIRSFRLTRVLFEGLCVEIVPLLLPKKNSRSIDPVTKILCALHFFGSYQGAVGKDIDAPMAQQTVSKCLQQICDINNRILNFNASYGGATHDSFIWQNSIIREHFETIIGQGERTYLLGDSGYPLREFMTVPVEGALEDSPEGRYNAIQKRARCTIERTSGILKGRWRCLLAARELHSSPQVAGNIIIACSVLHSICIAARLEPIELTDKDSANEVYMQPHVRAPETSTIAALQRGRLVRQQIIDLF